MATEITGDRATASGMPNHDGVLEIERFEKRRRLARRRGHCFQRRYLYEKLRDSDEHLEIQGDHGSNHVDPPPSTCQVAPVAREDGNREHD
jgi:hypothetical protein